MNKNNTIGNLDSTYSLLFAGLGVLVIVSVIGLGLSSGTAKAQDVNATAAETPVTIGVTPAPIVVDIDDAGQTIIRGVVSSVDTNVMTVESWGGEWTIRTTAEAGVIPSANNVENTGDLTAIAVGDFVGAEGTLATDSEWTLDAVFVRDWTTDPYPGDFETAVLSADASTGVTSDGSVDAASDGTDADATSVPLLSEDTEMTEEDTDTTMVDEITYSGVVDSKSDFSFTFTDDFDSTYVVYDDPETILVNSDSEIVTFDDIEEGDEVELEGMASGNVMEPSIIYVE